MRTVIKTLAMVLVSALIASHAGLVQAAEKPRFKLAWSIYVGWMPWEYADSQGIVDR